MSVALDDIVGWAASVVDNDAVVWVEFADRSPFVAWVDAEPASYLAVWRERESAERQAADLEEGATACACSVGMLEALLDEHHLAGVSVDGEWLVERLAVFALLAQYQGDGVFRAALGPHEDVLIRRWRGPGDWQVSSVPLLTGDYDLGDIVSVRVDDVLGLAVSRLERPADRLRVRILSRPGFTADRERVLQRRLLALGPAQAALIAGVGQAVSYERVVGDLDKRVRAVLVDAALEEADFEIGRGRRLDDALARARGSGNAVVPGGTLGPISHPEPVNDVQRKVVDDVRRTGWHGVSVHRGPGWDGPAFYYTIGLQATHGHPELVIVGLTGDVSHDIANGAVEEIEAGRELRAGSRSDALLEGSDVRIAPVDVSAVVDWLVLAHWLYGDEPWSAVQVLWPDRTGLFPDEDGYDHKSSPQEILPG